MKKTKEPTIDVEALRRSPLRGIQPIEEKEIDISLVDIDPTNPGLNEHSSRYERRWPDMKDSIEILDNVVYPIVVCEQKNARGRYLLIDGHGRNDLARRVGKKRLRA